MTATEWLSAPHQAWGVFLCGTTLCYAPRGLSAGDPFAPYYEIPLDAATALAVTAELEAVSLDRYAEWPVVLGLISTAKVSL